MKKDNQHNNRLSKKFEELEYLKQFEPSDKDKEETFSFIEEQYIKDNLSKMFYDENYYQEFPVTSKDWKHFKYEYLYFKRRKRILWLLLPTLAILLITPIGYLIYNKKNENAILPISISLKKENISTSTPSNNSFSPPISSNPITNKNKSPKENIHSPVIQKQKHLDSISENQNNFSFNNLHKTSSNNSEITKNKVFSNNINIPHTNTNRHKLLNTKKDSQKEQTINTKTNNKDTTPNNYLNKNSNEMVILRKADNAHKNYSPLNENKNQEKTEDIFIKYNEFVLTILHPHRNNTLTDTMNILPIKFFDLNKEKTKKWNIQMAFGGAINTNYIKNSLSFSPYGSMQFTYSLWQMYIQSGVYYYYLQNINSQLLLYQNQKYDFGYSVETKELQYNRLNFIGFPIRLLYPSKFGNFGIGISYDLIISSHVKFITNQKESLKSNQQFQYDKNYFTGLNTNLNTLLFKYELPLFKQWLFASEFYYTLEKLQKNNYPFNQPLENMMGMRITIEYKIFH